MEIKTQNSNPTPRAVILLSGGLDSLTCLAIAKHQGYEVFTLNFDYGQKHRSELAAAEKIAAHYQVPHRIIQLYDLGQMGGSALTDTTQTVHDYSGSAEIPNTYVPARNLIFLSIATAYAETLNAEAIFMGVSSIDYSHYPDCRPEFVQAFSNLIQVGTKAGIEGHGTQLKTPLLYLSKAETIQIGLNLHIDYGMSISCYRADPDGLACGTCDSCTFRKKGFATLGVPDPTRYVLP